MTIIVIMIKIKNKEDQHKLNTNSEVIKLFSCSAQLRLKFILLIYVKMPTVVGILTKMPTVVGILTFISRINYRLW